jgi:hypothetical protein
MLSSSDMSSLFGVDEVDERAHGRSTRVFRLSASCMCWVL